MLGAGGRVYYHAHLSRFAEGLRIAQNITPDAVIGYVGNTGNARTTPSHLHFGVYSPEGAMDPLPLLADRPPELHASYPVEVLRSRLTHNLRCAVLDFIPKSGLALGHEWEQW